MKNIYDNLNIKIINCKLNEYCLFRSEQSYNLHASSMPWPSIPYTNINLRQELTECFDVRGIPYLVLIDSNGNIITENGRSEISEDPDGLVKYICFIVKKLIQFVNSIKAILHRSIQY